MLYCDANFWTVSSSPALLVSIRANWLTPCWASEYAALCPKPVTLCQLSLLLYTKLDLKDDNDDDNYQIPLL
jgi:hypothetical protein